MEDEMADLDEADIEECESRVRVLVFRFLAVMVPLPLNVCKVRINKDLSPDFGFFDL